MMRVDGGKETFLDLEKETERDPTTDICVGNDEVGESASGGIASGMVDYRIGYVVNEVLVVRVGELLGGVMLDLWENQGGERGGARSSGSGVFSQDCAVVGYACAVDVSRIPSDSIGKKGLLKERICRGGRRGGHGGKKVLVEDEWVGFQTFRCRAWESRALLE